MGPATAAKDSHNQRIAELIYDEEKIVTSASLASELKISRNEAQNLLNTFTKDHENKKVDMHVTYLLYGVLTNEQGVGVYLVKKEDLSDKKNKFENIATEAVYSIQKGKQVEFPMIALANSVQENGTCFITSKNCIKRNIKSKKLLIAQPTISSVKQNGTSQKNCPTGNENMNNDGKNNHKALSQKQQKGKQGGIASFFSKATAKLQTTVKVDDIKGLQSENSRPEVEVEVDVDAASSKASPKKEVVKQPPVDEKINTNSEIEKSVVKENQNSTKKRKKACKDKGPNKKRKRIQQICDSDSDDIFDDSENNDIIEMSDEEPVHVPAAKPPPVPKNKKRKAVDKTYVDEEGFIVTTTEYVYETASEGENEEPPKPKPEKKNEKKDKISPDQKPSGGKGKNKKNANGKQPTLLSFFKKN